MAPGLATSNKDATSREAIASRVEAIAGMVEGFRLWRTRRAGSAGGGVPFARVGQERHGEAVLFELLGSRTPKKGWRD